jgi:hypothetical protein
MRYLSRSFFALASPLAVALAGSADAQSIGGAMGQDSRATIQISLRVLPRFEVEAPVGTAQGSDPGESGRPIVPELRSNAPDLRFATVLEPVNSGEAASEMISADGPTPKIPAGSPELVRSSPRQPLVLLVVPD